VSVPGLVDSHCHLQTFGGEEIAAVLDRARARGVTGFLAPASRLDEAEGLLALAEREPGVWCALGVHPHEAASWQPGDERRLAALLAHPRAVAVGECGLDFHYDHAPRPVQEAVFRTQCELAIDLGLPVIVHNRESDDRLLALLAEPALAPLAADLHSFAGGGAMARRLRDRPFVFGVSGMVTFKKAENVREALPLFGADQLLVETDSPYLAPVPYRGLRNEPAYVVEVAARVAAELGCEPGEIARRSRENFFRFFAKARA